MSVVDVARTALTDALRPHIKGRNAPARLEKAVNDAMEAIGHMLSVQKEIKRKKVGATVMTESASMSNRPPRSL